LQTLSGCFVPEIRKYSVNPFPYRHKIVAQTLRSGYSQMSLTGTSCRWREDFLPRPALRGRKVGRPSDAAAN